MNLKVVVASMSFLGLVSCPLFAAAESTDAVNQTDTSAATAPADTSSSATAPAASTDTSTTTDNSAAAASTDTSASSTAPAAEAATPAKAKGKAKHHVKHRHHKVVRHHAPVRHHVIVSHDYKDMAYPVQPAPVEVCTIGQPAMIIGEATQNVGRAMPSPCNPGWYNRIQVAGGVNVDMGKWGNRNANFQGVNYQRFSLNDAYVNVGAVVNDWTKAFVSISYSDATPTGGTDSNVYGYSSVYRPFDLTLEQAFGTWGNFEVSPFYVQIGKQFQDFSRYEIHPITRSMTQVLSEILRTSAKIGFVTPMGFDGSVYAFDDAMPKIGKNQTNTNYGAALGYDVPSDQLGWDVGVAYVYNMIGEADVAHGVSNFTGVFGYHSRVGAVAAYADVNSGPYSLAARYTTAVQRFNFNDMPKNGVFDLIAEDVVSPFASGAKPWAAGLTAGYDFEFWGCRNNNLYLGYQASGQAAGLGLPKSRWQAGYGIEVWRNTDFTLEYDHDDAYSVTRGGNGNDDYNLITLRASVKFS